jgi:hypothetical protein
MTHVIEPSCRIEEDSRFGKAPLLDSAAETDTDRV